MSKSTRTLGCRGRLPLTGECPGWETSRLTFPTRRLSSQWLGIRNVTGGCNLRLFGPVSVKNKFLHDVLVLFYVL